LPNVSGGLERSAGKPSALRHSAGTEDRAAIDGYSAVGEFMIAGEALPVKNNAW
jgi:hypothetical protein